jgi:oligopeptide transport system substrate-binding protein
MGMLSRMRSWIIRIALLLALAAGVKAFHEARQNREPRVREAARNGILLTGNSTEIETMDPNLATGVPEHKVISALFEGLVAPDAENPDANAPGAAVSWTHDAYTRWTFKLQPDGRWSDGTPVTSGDFAYGFQRILSPEFAADYATMLYPLKNAERFNKGDLTDFSQVGVRTPDPQTLELTLEGPAPYLPGMLKHYTWFPIPRHVVERHGRMIDRLNPWNKPAHIISNGPFKLKTWRFTHYLAAERNPHYWDRAAVKLNEVHFFPIASDTTEERAFRDQQLHLTDTVPLTRVPHYRESNAAVYQASPNLGTHFFRFNVTKPPFDDVRVRQALSLAVDRESLVNHVLRAGQTASYGLTPPGCAEGYNTPKKLTFDPARARQLLADAGYADGKGFPKVDLLITQSSAARTISEATQEMWKQHLGIQVGVLNQEWQVYLDAMRKLEFAVAIAGWVGDYPDPLTFLSLWRTGDGNNNTGWSSPRFDELVNAALLNPDLTARFQQLETAESLLLDELPIVPLYWRVDYYLKSPLVKNYRTSLLEHRAYKAIEVSTE